MIAEGDIIKWAEAALDGTLSKQEEETLAAQRAADAHFNAQFEECYSLLLSLKSSGSRQRFRAMMQDVHQAQKQQQPQAAPVPIRVIPLRTHYLRTAAVAAGMAVLTTLSSVWFMHRSEKAAGNATRNITQLRREVERVKSTQSQQQRQLNTIADKQPSLPATPAPGNFSGTGFALTNDGYIATNYHVTAGADSIYIQTPKGWRKAHVVVSEPKADVAVLKVDDNSFRFSRNDIPYSFASGKSQLGERIFSLGFPQDEIVYNEGYVASRNGFQGDTGQYRLELPASPGQSGAPVLDGKGNIIGMITGKESQSEGTTYATSSKALLKLLDRLPKDVSLRVPRSSRLSRISREQQIQRVQEYTCMIQVYKGK